MLLHVVLVLTKPRLEYTVHDLPIKDMICVCLEPIKFYSLHPYSPLQTMKYRITKLTIDFPGFIDINEDEYLRIKTARENLFEVLFLEEKLDLVTENYHEYETELLSLASRIMIFHDDDYFSISSKRNVINRRIANLMSACRMYLDHCVHHLNNVYDINTDKINEVKKEMALQYELKLGYRVMEALRNYVQHRGIPVHKVSLSSSRVEDDGEFRLRHTIIPFINIAILEDDEKFKRSVLDEMKEIQIKGEIDIKPLIREYVEGIGKVHEKIRELIQPDFYNWENILNSTITKFQKEFGNEVTLTGLAIVAENKDGRLDEKKVIFKDFIDRCRALERKNRFFNNLHRSYASNEIKE